MKTTLLFVALLLLMGCASSKTKQTGNTSQRSSAPAELLDEQTFKITEVSTDRTYGYTEKNPIKVGGESTSGPLNERRFLNALAGPHGEAIRYVRTGSCCQFKTDNGFMGAGLLDRYRVEWEGQSEPVILYLNMYDPGEMKAPLGFSIKASVAQSR